MRNIFSCWENFEQKVRRSPRPLLLFDFDGTLAKIVQNPNSAKLEGKTKQLLHCLSHKKGTVVGIISGRSLKDIKKRVGLRRLFYGGNHGLELAGPGLRFRHIQAFRKKTKINLFARLLEIQAQKIKGLEVENKGLTISLHFRNVSAKNKKQIHGLRDQVETMCQRFGLKFRFGKKVFEVRPDVEWDKGALLQWLVKKMKRSFVVFVGDDLTDEDAFQIVKRQGLGVRVGASNRSCASYYLRSQNEVRKFLERLVTLWN